MSEEKKLTRRRGGRGENQRLIIPPPRSPRLRVKLSSPSRCCTNPSPENCNFQNMSSQTTYAKNMAQKSKNIDIRLSLCKEISIFFT